MYYDFDVVVDYETDDDYRRCLLAVFRLESFEGIVAKVEALSKATESTGKELHDAAAQLGGDIESTLHFFLLFNYNDFKRTHETLKKLYGNS